MMKIFQRDEEEMKAESLTPAFNHDKADSNLFNESEDKDEAPACDQCGYIHCICAQK